MDATQIGIAGLVAMVGLMAMRVPVGIALALTSIAGIWATMSFGVAVGMLRAIPYQFVANFVFTAVPMFLLMGYIASHAGLTSGLFRTMRLMLYRVPGGLACSTVGACALFAAASGSSVATAAAMGKITIPEMRKAGYDDGLATGCVAAAGTLGSMIPPSIIMVIFGVFTMAPIGQLFMAGFLPGILTALVYALMIVVRVKLNPSLAPDIKEKPAPGELRAAIADSWPLPVLVAGVIGGIYAGLVTPTEAAAVGASLASVIALVRGTFTKAMLYAALKDTVIGTSSLFVIAMGASMFTAFMGLAGLPEVMATNVLAFSKDPLLLILAISVLYIILGMFIDSLGIILLTLPFLLPLLNGAQIDLIWFGILVVKLLEIGLITPPFGMNVFVIHSMLRGAVTLPTIFKGVGWFIAMEVVVLGLLIALPAIALWLPSKML
jgi:tripartite ATP-independent transporter DctM subunit